jgi:hypothetical protein
MSFVRKLPIVLRVPNTKRFRPKSQVAHSQSSLAFLGNFSYKMPFFLASKGFINSNMIMIQCYKYNRRKKERREEERDREVSKPGRNSRPFCLLLSLHEPNVYFGRNSRPIYINLRVNDLSHSTLRYRETNEK